MVRVAVLGAGPTGLEAALAANDRGWAVTVYEQAPQVAGFIRDWGHVRMFTPWSMSLSPRVEAAFGVPGPDCPTGAEFAAHLDRVAALLPPGSLRLSTRVDSVAREWLLKNDEIGTPTREHQPFRVLSTDPDGAERMDSADVVIDATGTYGNPSPTGNGGIPAVGERSARIVRRIPEVDAAWAGRRVLVVGSGYSAQTAARDLDAVGAALTWAVRRLAPTWGAVVDDVLPDRVALVASSRSIERAGSVLAGVVVEQLRTEGDEMVVTLRAKDGATREVTVDTVVSLTGSVPDASLYRQLQVHECYATEGVMSLAATLLGADGGDCLTQVSPGVDILRNPEPRFFVLGSKSYGRTNTFLLRVGWEQVEQVFAALDDELLVPA